MRSMITIIIESKEGVGQNDYRVSDEDDDASAKEVIRLWMERGKIIRLHTFDD